MLTLLSEIHFWSTLDDVTIKDNDYGAFRYVDRKENTQSCSYQSKKLYAEKRNYVWNLANKKPAKIRDKLKDLEELIQLNKIVYIKWLDSSILQLMLSTGMLVNIFVDILTGDAVKISFDKYLVGKLQSESISDVLITRSHMLCTYNDNQITLVNFTKPLYKQSVPEKIAKLEPKIKICELAGPSGRKLDRKMSVNVSGDKLLVWWRSTRDEVYPWSPLVKDQDRANVHVYTLSGLKLDLLCHRRTEFDPVGIAFSTIEQNVVHFVEQKVSRKGEVSIETSTFEIAKNKLQQMLITSIPLQTQVCCHAFSPDNEKLLLGCIDGSVVLFDQGRGVTHVVKAAFIPTIVFWHLDGSLIFVANERSQIQCFDVSLACIKTQFINEEISSSNVLDLTMYFKNQPSLLQMIWNKKPEIPYFYAQFSQTDSLLLLVFERGPLAILRLFGTSGLKGDVHNIGFAPDVLVYEYISKNQIDRAIGILLSLNWEIYGVLCLVSLQRIMNHLFRQTLTPEREAQIQRALGSFYAPLQPISTMTHSEYGDQVKDLTRKFFHLLIRYQLYEKAFCLAIDINDYDLFMDLYYCAQVLKDSEMANAALVRAKEQLSRSNSNSSQSSCSECSDLDSDQPDDWQSYSQEVPPLPVTTKINIHSTPSLHAYTPPLPITNRICTNALLNNPFPIPKIPSQLSANAPLKFYAPNLQHGAVNAKKVSIPQVNLPVIPIPKPKTEFQSSFNIDSSIFKPKPELSINPIILRPNVDQLRVKTGSFARYNTPKYFQSSPLFNSTPREIIHKTVSLSIPSPSVTNSPSKVTRPLRTTTPLKVSATQASTATKPSSEKNVKFSDTVTAFIVPEISREKPAHLKEKPKKPSNIYMTDPKQELADSLPLCHPNEEYLKDFTPISTNTSDDENPSSKIKVVHFGMV